MKEQTTKTPMLKRTGCLLLALLMLLSLVPGITPAAHADADPTPTAFAMGMDGVRDYMEKGDGTYDYVEFGGLKWRVLDTENDAGNSNTGVLLLSENVLNYGQPWNGYRIYSDRNGTSGQSDGDTTLGYSVSDVRAYLTGDASHTYTKFQTGTSLSTSELYYTIVNYYYYRTEAEGKVQANTQYYTRDADSDSDQGYALYGTMTENDFNAGNGGFYTKATVEGVEVYTKATTYTSGTDYYYDKSTYSVAEGLTVGQNLPTGTKYYCFSRVTGASASSSDQSKALGCLYYIGYHTTGTGRPTSSNVTRTIVSGKSGDEVNFATDYGFTEQELAAVLSTVKTTPYTESNKYTVGSYGFYGGSLTGDTFFLLSADEADNASYGFTDNANRVGKDLGSSSRYWWLRSSSSLNFPGNVILSGAFYVSYANYNFLGLRPAFNLNLTSVIFASAAAGGKSSAAVGGGNGGSAAQNFWTNPAPSGTSDWKLTLADSGLSVSADTLTKNSDGSYTLAYSGASASGDGVYLSALLLDGSGTVSYGYERLAAIDDASAQSGTVTFILPSGVSLDNYNIKFFLERCTDGSTACDYASAPASAATVVDESGTHTGEWKSDATGHWHEDANGTLVGSKVGHTFTNWVDDRESCEVAGEQHRYCTVCGYEETQAVSAGSHSWVTDKPNTEYHAAVEPNCTTGGNYAYYTCSMCGMYGRVDSVDDQGNETISANSELSYVMRSALGHIYSNSSLCTENYEVVQRDADGNYVSGNVELVCDGTQHWLRYYCTNPNCPKKNSDSKGNPEFTNEGHTGNSYNHNIACGTTSQCTGTRTTVKNGSGNTLTLSCTYTPSTTWEHTPGTTLLYVTYADGANPCTDAGNAWYECVNCGDPVEVVGGYPAKGHLYSADQITKYPTYDEAGEGYKYCVRCGEVQNVTIAQLTRADASVEITGETNVPWTGSAVTAGHNSDTDTFSFSHFSGGSASQYDNDEDKEFVSTVTWYSVDGDTETKLDEAPSALGSYKLKIDVPQTDKYDTYGAGVYGYNAATGVMSFNIVKADQTEPGLTLTTTGPEAAENTVKITGSASASVSTSPYESAALSYTSGSTSVATIDSATGAITLVGSGTTDITATYAETAHYNSSSKTVTLTVLPRSSAAVITGFTVGGESGTIGTDTVSVTVPYTVSLSSVTPTITVSDYATVSPASGTTVAFTEGTAGDTTQDGTYTYTVTAEDGTTKTYTVTVTRTLETVTSVTAPSVQYIPDGTSNPIDYLNTNYGSTTAMLEGGGSVSVSVTWELENAGGADYDDTQGESNTFRWTATAPTGYNAGSADYNGTADIENQPVSETPQGSISSDPGTLTLSSDTTLNTVTLTLTLTAGTQNPSYQWQRLESGTWTDVSGATAVTLTLSGMDMTYNGASYRCAVKNSEGGVKADSVGYIMASPLSVLKGSQSAPTTAAFSAVTMLLSGVDSTMEYSLDGTNYNAASDTSVDLTGSLTAACTISVRYAETEYLNASDAQSLTVTKASTPAVTAVQPTDIGGNGGINGTDGTMEVSADSGSTWTAPASDYAPGTYLVRVKATGTALASDTASVTVKARYAVTYDNTEHVTVTGVPDSALEGENISFNVAADTGYKVAVSVNGTEQSAATTYTYTVTGTTNISFAVTAKTYTVQFVTSGSSCTAITVTYGEAYGTLPATTRTAYRFDGWYLEQDYTTLIESTTTVSTAGDHILYAKFTAKGTLTPNMSKVSVYYDGNAHGVTPKFKCGDTEVTDGFTVSYKTTGAADSTYTTVEPVNEGDYTVRFVRAEDADYAAFDKAIELLEIKKAQISAAALSVTAPAQGGTPDSVVTADSSPNYTVNSDTAWSPTVSTFGYDTAYTVTVTLSANEHYAFADSFAVTVNDASATKSLTDDKKTATVTYTFSNTEKEKFTVTFKNGDTTVDEVQVDSGDTLAVADFPDVPAKTGYTGAWDRTTDIENISADMTVNADYTANSYTVKFAANGADGTMSDQTMTYDTAANLTANAFTKTGYTFSGWKNGDTTYTDGQSVSNLTAEANGEVTLTAQWTANTYTVKFEGNGADGGEMSDQSMTYDTAANLTANAFTKTGYTFKEWSDGTNTYTDGQSVSNLTATAGGSVTLTAQWAAATNTAYTVKHHKQDLGATTFTIADTDNLTGTTGEDTNATEKSYDGFTAQSFSQEKIAANGTTVIDIYYDRDTHKVTYSYNGTAPTGAPALPAEASYEYGATVTVAAAPTLTGYTFSGWSQTGSFEMGTADVTITGSWTANGDTAYTVKHYTKDLGADNYTLADTENLTGTTGENTAATAKSYEGFTAQTVTQQTIAADGTTVIDIYYNRDTHKVTYSYTGTAPTGAPALPAEASYEYGATVTVAAAPNLTGYTFSGWSKTGSFTMGTVDVEITGSWTANGDTAYTVEHYKQDLGKTTYTLADTDNLTGTTGEDTNATAKSYEGFTAQTITQKTIAADGTTVVEIYYNRDTHKVTYSYTGTAPAGAPALPAEASYEYGATVTVEAAPTLTGYTFSGWSQTESFTMGTVDVTITGSWTATVYNITYTLDGGGYDEGGSNPATYTIEESVVLFAPKKAGYTFAGWTGSNGTTPQTSVTIALGSIGDKSYTANWTANTYTVKFAANGADGTMSDQTMTYDVEANLKSNTFTKTGYTFKEWKNGDTAYADKASVSNLTAEAGGEVTLTAQWTANTYTVKFEGNGADGGTMSPQSMTYDTAANLTKNDFTKTGYVFNGWKDSNNNPYNDEASVKNLTATANGEVTLTAQWTAAPNTAYTVEHYLEKAEGGYEIASADTETMFGTTDTETAAVARSYTGFEAQPVTQGTIAADSSTVVKIYYDRKSYTVSYAYDGTVPAGADDLLPASADYKYGTSVTVAAAPTLTGYTFSGWSKTGSTFAMPAENVTITGSWTARGDTAYKVEYYFEILSSNNSTLKANYEIKTDATDNLTGQTGATATAAVKDFAGFTYNASLSTASGTIAADGTLVLSMYYKRNSYEVSYGYTGTVPTDATALPATASYKYEATVAVAPDATATGYTFSGWTWKFTEETVDPGSGESSMAIVRGSGSASFVMPADNVSVTGSFLPNPDTPYTVRHYLEKLDGGYDLKEEESKVGTTSMDTAAAAKSYNGYEAQPITQKKIAANGTTVVEIYYDRKSYTVSYAYTGTVPTGAEGLLPASADYKYGETVTVAAAPTLTGYTFSGWSKTGSFEMPYSDTSITGSWTPITYTVKFDNSSAEGGTKPADLTATYDKPFTLPANTMTREGYELAGWATVADGALVYADKATVKDNLASVQDAEVTLYPVWTVCALAISDKTDEWDIPVELETAATYGPLTAQFKHKDGSTSAATAENLTWSIVDCPAGVSIDAASGKVTVQPGTSIATIKIKAVHKNGAQATADIKLVSNYMIVEADISGVNVDTSTMWVDGIPYNTTLFNDGKLAKAKVAKGEYNFVTFYSYAGTQYDYCTHMYVWQLEQVGSKYVGERIDEFDDIMKYCGVSIRIIGVKGMRVVTGIPDKAKISLINSNLAGYKLVQTGTVVVKSEDIDNVVLTNSDALSGYAYNRGTADPVFGNKDGLTQYTNAFINLTYEKCKLPLSFRSYMILENSEGKQIVLYGGVVTRSVSYVAWQNKDAYAPGTTAYNFIWDIIRNTGAEEQFGN